MNLVAFYDDKNISTTFHPFDNAIGLPFPIFLTIGWKLFISVSLILTLFFGIKLRLIIFKYLAAPATNLGPINNLIFMDQLNGLLLAPVIVVRIGKCFWGFNLYNNKTCLGRFQDCGRGKSKYPLWSGWAQGLGETSKIKFFFVNLLPRATFVCWPPPNSQS
jgi:hypothetical protein